MAHWRVRIVAGTVGALALLVAPEAGAGAALHRGAGPSLERRVPHISAPARPAVRTRVRLVGTGFPAGRTLTIVDCSATGWIVPQDPCAAHVVTVRTDRRGRFVLRRYLVRLCPRPVALALAAPGTRTCWIGAETVRPVDGVDLLGAAKVVIRYP